MLDRSALYATDFGEDGVQPTAEAIRQIEAFLAEYEERLSSLPFEATVCVDSDGFPVVSLKTHEGGPSVTQLTIYFCGEAKDEDPYVVAFTWTDTLDVGIYDCATFEEIFFVLTDIVLWAGSNQLTVED